MILQLKRFNTSYDKNFTDKLAGFFGMANDGPKHEKIKTFVDYPLEIDMRPYVLSINDYPDPVMYDLYAVSNHVGKWKGWLGDGTLKSGHYNAYCKYAMTGEWYFYDDDDRP